MVALEKGDWRGRTFSLRLFNPYRCKGEPIGGSGTWGGGVTRVTSHNDGNRAASNEQVMMMMVVVVVMVMVMVMVVVVLMVMMMMKETIFIIPSCLMKPDPK